MITASHIIQVSESFSKADITNYGSEIYIFVNPTSSDFTEMNKRAKEENRKLDGFRFVPDLRTKKVYIADIYGITHNDIRKTERLPMQPVPYCFDGIASWSGGRAVMTGYYPDSSNDKAIGGQIEKADWSWVDPYVKNCSAYFTPFRMK